MTRRFLLPILAVGGFLAAIIAVFQGDQPPPAPSAPLPSLAAPFQHYVAGSGLVEAITGNIAIGTPVAGIVSAIDVSWGDRVKAGAPLFNIDDRDLQSQLVVAKARAEEAEANFAKAENLLKVGENLTSGASISAVDLANRHYDVDLQQAALSVAKAQVEQIRTEAERRTIRAPLAGRVLQINTHVGEYAESGAANPPLMLFGDDGRLQVRVEIDENDAWRIKPTAAAVAYIPGAPDLKTALKFERIERYVIPKTSLTGASAERTDTRVLQVLYSFDPAALPVYVGQRMNVFVESPAVTDGQAPSLTHDALHER